MKKIVCLMLAIMLTLSCGVIITAAPGDPGSITIKEVPNTDGDAHNNVDIAGKTFVAWQILELAISDGMVTSYKYSVPEEMKDFYIAYFALTEQEQADIDDAVYNKLSAMNDNSEALQAFANHALSWLQGEGYTDGVTTIPSHANVANLKQGEENVPKDSDATSVTISNLPLGYYLVEDATIVTTETHEKTISALMLTTTKPAAEVNIKATHTEHMKEIRGSVDEDPSTGTDTKFNTASIGEIVPFKITTRVPSMVGYTKYIFQIGDNMSKGLTFLEDIKITIGGDGIDGSREGDEEPLEEGVDYIYTVTPTADGGTEIYIVFQDFIKFKNRTGDRIEVTYSALVNEDATPVPSGIPNVSYVIYSNDPTEELDDPNDRVDDTDPVGRTPDDEVRTYTTGIKIIKVDENEKPLTGAAFKIEGTRLAAVVTYTDEFKPTDGYYEDEAGEYYKINGEYTTTPPGDADTSDGKRYSKYDESELYWKLKDGTYTQDDPNAEGMDQSKYDENITQRYVLVTVKTYSEEPAGTVEHTAYVGKDGVLVIDGLGPGRYTITEVDAPKGYNILDNPITVNITCSVPQTPDTIDAKWWREIVGIEGYGASEYTERIEIVVVNKPGDLLPETGGIGTTIFYVFGGVMVLGAAVLLVAKKRTDSVE